MPILWGFFFFKSQMGVEFCQVFLHLLRLLDGFYLSVCLYGV